MAAAAAAWERGLRALDSLRVAISSSSSSSSSATETVNGWVTGVVVVVVVVAAVVAESVVVVVVVEAGAASSGGSVRGEVRGGTCPSEKGVGEKGRGDNLTPYCV